MQIIGAGLAGLIASNAFPQAHIIEAQGRDKVEHNALLRFRSKVVSDLTGIEFRKVFVRKGIWHEGRFAGPSILLANLYAQKVVGKLADRSIWNLEATERYIAPENFISQLIDNAGSRITWDEPFDIGVHSVNKNPTISTMPMSLLAKMVEAPFAPVFEHGSIVVARSRVKAADVFQTIYFTDPRTPVYRASITKDLLIVEAMDVATDANIQEVLDAFGIIQHDPIGETKHGFGKIAPIDDVWRRNFIFRMSAEQNIYSVGRFAVWRNILLDDVVQDLSVVKRLINLGGIYYKCLNK